MLKIDLFLNIFENFFDKENINYNAYKRSLIKIIKFCKNNFNILTYDTFFFFFKKIDLDDIGYVIYILKKMKIKIINKITYNHLFIKVEEKERFLKLKKNKNYYNSLYYNKTQKYKNLSIKGISKNYKIINKQLHKLSKKFLKNIVLISNIFNSNKKSNLNKLIYKIKNIKSNLKLNASVIKPEDFITKTEKFKNNKEEDTEIKNKLNIETTFITLNFLTVNMERFRLKKKEEKRLIMASILKSKYVIFKVTLSMLDDFYFLLKKKITHLMNIRYKIYDSISNISNISYLKFNFFFLKYGSNFDWIINILNLSDLNKSFKDEYIKFINKERNKIKNIEKKYIMKIRTLFKIFNFIEIYKYKIDICRSRIIKSKLNLVNKITRKNYNNVFYNDYIQEANLSLIKSVNDYNFKEFNNFDTFIINNIKRCINDYIYKKNKLIKLPSYMSNTYKKIVDFSKYYFSLHGIHPDTLQISKNLNISTNRVIKVLNFYSNPLSINQEIGDDGNLKLEEIIKDEKNPDLDKEMFGFELENQINDILQILDSRSYNIINMRYGINSKKYTLEEIGIMYNISKERVRQLQNAALKKLRDFPGSKYRLKNFFNYRDNSYFKYKGL